MENGGAVLDHSCVDTRTIGDSFLVPHNFTSVAYGRQSTEKLELLVGPLRVLSGKILHRPIQKNYAESRNYAEFAAWCTVHLPNWLKLCRPSRKDSTVQKAQIILSCFLQTPKSRTTPGIHVHGKSERRFRRHFPARDIAKEDLLQRHRDPQSIRSDTSPTRKRPECPRVPPTAARRSSPDGSRTSSTKRTDGEKCRRGCASPPASPATRRSTATVPATPRSRQPLWPSPPWCDSHPPHQNLLGSRPFPLAKRVRFHNSTTEGRIRIKSARDQRADLRHH